MPKDPENVPIFVLGNKMDLEHERAVSKDKVAEYMRKNPEFKFFETSAVEGQNVNEVFVAVVQNHLKLKNNDGSTASSSTPSSQTDYSKKKFDLE